MKLKPIVLASTSIYRKQLLEQLGISFTAQKPLLDEDAEKNRMPGALPIELAEHLSRAKGKSLFDSLQKSGRDALVISGDQLVQFKNEILGKPHTSEKAVLQLEKMAGQNHQLITAVTLTSSETTLHLNHITQMKMKKLSRQEIENYVQLDQPLDCAGAYKIEKHGIGLFEQIDCSDFSAIQGLPLIWLSNTLQGMGYELFKR